MQWMQVLYWQNTLQSNGKQYVTHVVSHPLVPLAKSADVIIGCSIG